MTVIAMTREMGSLGKDVALELATQLNIEVIHHELVERDLAQRLDLGESDVHRFLEGGASLFERWKIDKSKLSRYTAEEILELASRGNVLIRGWGAAQLLRSIPNVLCVRVCAPMRFRTQVLMKRLGMEDQGLASREIERNDAAHARTIQAFFAADWEDPLNYDIVLNTARVPVKACAEQIIRLAKLPEFQETDDSRRVLSDKLVEARINTVLDQHLGSAGDRRGIEIEVDSGKVTVFGATTSSVGIEDIVAQLREVEGVTSVDNQLVHLDAIYAS